MPPDEQFDGRLRRCLRTERRGGHRAPTSVTATSSPAPTTCSWKGAVPGTDIWGSTSTAIWPRAHPATSATTRQPRYRASRVATSTVTSDIDLLPGRGTLNAAAGTVDKAEAVLGPADGQMRRAEYRWPEHLHGLRRTPPIRSQVHDHRRLRVGRRPI